jgi:protein-disulfide isomerase
MRRLPWKTIRESLETLAILAACGGILFAVVGRTTAGPVATPAVAEDIAAQNLTVHLNPEQTLGDATAPLVILEFSDFECSYCSRHARETIPRLRTELVDKARVRLAFKHFPLENIHPVSRAAARYATCAGRQSRFWDMHSRLFGSGKLSLDVLARTPGELSLNSQVFDDCLTQVDKEIALDQQDGRRLGVASTPTLFIGRTTGDNTVALLTRITGAQPFDTIAAAIAAAPSAPARRWFW